MGTRFQDAGVQGGPWPAGGARDVQGALHRPHPRLPPPRLAARRLASIGAGVGLAMSIATGYLLRCGAAWLGRLVKVAGGGRGCAGSSDCGAASGALPTAAKQPPPPMACRTAPRSPAPPAPPRHPLPRQVAALAGRQAAGGDHHHPGGGLPLLLRGAEPRQGGGGAGRVLWAGLGPGVAEGRQAAAGVGQVCRSAGLQVLRGPGLARWRRPCPRSCACARARPPEPRLHLRAPPPPLPPAGLGRHLRGGVWPVGQLHLQVGHAVHGGGVGGV